MEKLKRILFRLPEFYLIAVVLMTWFPMKTILNPIAWGALIILTLQIIYRNKISGLFIGSLFLLANLLMFMALLSEFSEFPTINAKALQLILVGTFLIVLNITIAAIMISNYLRSENRVVSPY